MNSDRFGGQTHLILPVVLASIALLAIGFAVSALVGTGTSVASDSPSTLTYEKTSTITQNGTTSTVVHTLKGKVRTKRIGPRVVTRNGSVVTLPASTERFTNVTTLPGKVRVTTRTTPGKVTTRTSTITNTSTVLSTITNTSTIFSTVTVPTTVTSPPVTVTVTTTVP